jgi:hypothetical protein
MCLNINEVNMHLNVEKLKLKKMTSDLESTKWDSDTVEMYSHISNF